MRLVGRIKGEKEAFTFHAFLQKEGIEGRFEPSHLEQTFDIWIEHEDEVDVARHWMEAFKKDPEDPRFSVETHPIDSKGVAASRDPSPQPMPIRRSRPAPARAPLTRMIIILCALLFFWNGYQAAHLAKNKSGARFFNLTPLFIDLCYDVPATFPLLVKFFEEHPMESPKDLDTLSPSVEAEYKQIEETPSWEGIYKVILKWPKANQDLGAPMFIKLREGQVWRLFTPCLLHGGFLHILFNMLWLWLLGRQVEERIKLWRYVAITLIIGIVSNTAQYLMSGPLFIGYSGVITGLAGFIWMRQRLAPWEGYPLNRATLIFLGVFIFGMLVLQVVSFFLIRFELAHFPMNIANTAHITGAFTGMLLGRIPFFARGKL